MYLSNAALILVDIQNDLCSGGPLAVPDADQIIPIANKLLNVFTHFPVVCTQDWHPRNHACFAVNAGVQPYETFDLNGTKQVAWPIHCQQGTLGAELHRDLDFSKCGSVQHIVRGTSRDVDGYSGFYDERFSSSSGLLALVNRGSINDTGLYQYLRDRSILHVYIAGLALDTCVQATALDALALQFRPIIIEDGCRATSPENAVIAKQKLSNAGVMFQSSDYLIDVSRLSLV